MARFKINRPARPEKIYDKPWQDPDHDPLRPDKKRIHPEILSREQERRLEISNAKHMFKTFGYQNWMAGIIDTEGNEIIRHAI